MPIYNFFIFFFFSSLTNKYRVITNLEDQWADGLVLAFDDYAYYHL